MYVHSKAVLTLFHFHTVSAISVCALEPQQNKKQTGCRSVGTYLRQLRQGCVYSFLFRGKKRLSVTGCHTKSCNEPSRLLAVRVETGCAEDCSSNGPPLKVLRYSSSRVYSFALIDIAA